MVVESNAVVLGNICCCCFCCNGDMRVESRLIVIRVGKVDDDALVVAVDRGEEHVDLADFGDGWANNDVPLVLRHFFFLFKLPHGLTICVDSIKLVVIKLLLLLTRGQLFCFKAPPLVGWLSSFE